MYPLDMKRKKNMPAKLDLVPMADIMKANQEAGRFWFSPDTLRYFNSNIGGWAVSGAAGILFVSSEQRRGCKRLWTVREAMNMGAAIETVGDFQAYGTERAAWNAVYDLHYAAEQGINTKPPREFPEFPAGEFPPTN